MPIENSEKELIVTPPFDNLKGELLLNTLHNPQHAREVVHICLDTPHQDLTIHLNPDTLSYILSYPSLQALSLGGEISIQTLRDIQMIMQFSTIHSLSFTLPQPYSYSLPILLGFSSKIRSLCMEAPFLSDQQVEQYFLRGMPGCDFREIIFNSSNLTQEFKDMLPNPYVYNLYGFLSPPTAQW